MNEKIDTFESLSFLDQLKGLCLLQQELIRIALYVASKGVTEYEGEKVICTLSEPKCKISSLLAMTAAQSLGTVLNFSKLDGIPVRDCYPVARSTIESFINATYLLSETDAVAERAIKYIQFANWKHFNRKFGSGDFTIEIRSDLAPDKTLQEKFPEFCGKGQGSWTSLDAPSRIRRVGELSGKKAGARLLAAYGIVYSLSSEIIHGSPFGASFFYTGFLDKDAKFEDFINGTTRQLENILVAVLHAGCGYLSAFFEVQNMKKLSSAEERLFIKLFEVSTKYSEK